MQKIVSLLAVIALLLSACAPAAQAPGPMFAPPHCRQPSARHRFAAATGPSKRLQIAAVAAGVGHVVGRRMFQAQHLLVGQLAHDLAGGADDQDPIGEDLAFGDQRASADQAVLADLGAIQYDRTDANKAAGTAVRTSKR